MAYRSNRNRREFEWVNSAGHQAVTYGGDEPGEFVWDLLGPAREAWGAAALRGATVVSVRGYCAALLDSGTTNSLEEYENIGGTLGFRVARSELPARNGTDSDEYPLGRGVEMNDWNFLNSFTYFHSSDWVASAAAPFAFAASGQADSSPWTVDVRANRILKELGQTYALFGKFTGLTTTLIWVNWSLRIGLKYPR